MRFKEEIANYCSAMESIDGNRLRNTVTASFRGVEG